MIQILDKQITENLVFLSKEEKKNILSIIKSIVQLKQSDEVNIKEYNKDLDTAMKRISEGKYTEHESVLKESKKW